LNWKAPDRIFVPVGNGCIVGAVYKGFYELLELGWIDRMPKIMGIQAQGSNYMYRAWMTPSGFDGASILQSKTAASSISVGLPRDRIKALRAIEASGGEFICVDDDQIFSAVVYVAKTSGVFVEPGAAAAYAGYLKFGSHADEEVSVVLLTGSGLKDISGLLKSGVINDKSEIDIIEE
jgi:threonine synthase